MVITRHGINTFLRDHLETVYRQTEGTHIQDLLGQISIPRISVDQYEERDSDLQIEELGRALKEMGRARVPGPDGLPVEYYSACTQVLLP